MNFGDYLSGNVSAPEHLYEEPIPFETQEVNTADQDFTDLLSNVSNTPKPEWATFQRFDIQNSFFDASMDLCAH